MRKALFAGISTLTALAAGHAVAGADYSTAWHAQIGDTAAVQTTAGGGAGVLVGVVDTGVQASNPEIAGRVSNLSSCAAVTFTCSSGYADDNGHGTAVASILAGSFSATAKISMSGVAPSASIVAEKVLNAQGSGYDVDVASGVIEATQAGAKIINLSLTYLPTAAMVAAVNYAAANGVTIVWAGGNSATALNNGVNSSGFSSAVASHLIFAGSVSSANRLSTFSNTPGSGGLVIGSSKVTYASLWLMAPGQNIVAPGIQFGSGAYAYWTGTSMSTPEIAGAAALLDAAWPVLARNGTTSQVLLSTATNLGSQATYGQGLLNIAKAFQPIGALTVTGVGGTSIQVTSLTGAMITGGALGPLSSVKSQLAAYTAFDSFQRNFTVNLSGLVTTATSANSLASNVTPVTTSTGATTAGHFMLVSAAAPAFAAMDADGAPADRLLGLLPGASTPAPSYIAFAGADGAFIAIGRGVPSALSFTQAAWGADSLAAQQADMLGVSSSLLQLAQGGVSGAIGAHAMGPVRFAAAWTSTPAPIGAAAAGLRDRSDASAAALSVTAKVTRRLTLGVTYSGLAEDNALLGSTYDAAGPLNFGARRQSRLAGASAAFDLGGKRVLMAEASVVNAAGGAGSGLIRQVSPLKATAWGVSFIQGDAFLAGDSLSLSVRQPLRVTSGEAELAMTSVDAQGNATTAFTPVSLAPSGHETDVTVGYAAPVAQRASFNGALSWRSDAENQAGVDDVAFHMGLHLLF